MLFSIIWFDVVVVVVAFAGAAVLASLFNRVIVIFCVVRLLTWMADWVRIRERVIESARDFEGGIEWKSRAHVNETWKCTTIIITIIMNCVRDNRKPSANSVNMAFTSFLHKNRGWLWWECCNKSICEWEMLKSICQIAFSLLWLRVAKINKCSHIFFTYLSDSFLFVRCRRLF